MYNLKTFDYTSGDSTYLIYLGNNVKNLSVGYIPLLNSGGVYSGNYYSNYFIYGEGLTELTFRTKIL